MIPNVRRDLRIHLLDEVYMLSKNMFYATYNKGNIRIKYLIEMQVNISLIDMMSSEIMSLNCVKKSYVDTSIRNQDIYLSYLALANKSFEKPIIKEQLVSKLQKILDCNTDRYEEISLFLGNFTD